MLHVLTQGIGDKRVSVVAFDDDATGCLFWRTPAACVQVSSFGRRLGARPSHYWSSTGPSAMVLSVTDRLEICSETGDLRHVRILDKDGLAYVEMSGSVLLNPDIPKAQNHCVDVKDEQMKPFGTFSARYLILGSCLQTCLFCMRLLWSIHVETSKSSEILWGRVISCIYSCICCQQLLVDAFGVAFAGERTGLFIQLVGTFAVLATTTPLLLLGTSQFFAEIAAACSILVVPTLVHYYRTKPSGLSARDIRMTSLWTVGLGVSTFGNVGLSLIIGGVYNGLLSGANIVGATIFLPMATAICELLFVAISREAYCRAAWPNRCGGTGKIPGDQLYIPVTASVACNHAVSECMRLAAVLAGVAKDGTFVWVGVAMSTLLTNILLRLSWFRFFLFQIARGLCGTSLARGLFGPSTWVKLHEEMKVFVGYFRFVPVVALVIARAVMYGMKPFHDPQTPAFNFATGCAILGFLCTEVLEDLIVVNELLPEAPVLPEMLRDPTSEMHPRALQAAERGHGHASGDFMSVVCDTEKQVFHKSIAHCRDDTTWGRLRRKLGQVGRLVPAPVLYGLREWPFGLHFTIIGIFCNLMLGMMSAFLGSGYLRGLHATPCPPARLLQSWFLESVPLAC